MNRRSALLVLAAGFAPAQERALHLRARRREAALPGSDLTRTVQEDLHWPTKATAIIVCDMWDGHYCQASKRRVEEMAPKMNQVLHAARRLGVTIIHAPSGTMDVYEGMPQRKRMQDAKLATPPVEIAKWCYHDPKSEAALPIDDQTEPCDDDVVGERVRRYTRQNALLDIEAPDGISDSGQEIYNYCEQEGIRNIVLMGVHLNMCVLGRPFGIRQQVRLGRSVVLARDLTDSMYDPRQKPYVSHDRGTALMVEHVERYWCPSIDSEDLTRLATGRPKRT
ncbi:MAG: isochorismatase family protein [Bryobacterales bacterium]|nr:isochorismatase family protein [Bryobacterales bacterium]